MVGKFSVCTMEENKVIKKKIKMWLVLVVNLTPSRITWEESLSEGLSASGWPVDMSVGIILRWLIYEDSPHCEHHIS